MKIMYPFVMPSQPFTMNAKQRRQMRRWCRRNKLPMRLADPRPFRWQRMLDATGTGWIPLAERPA